MNPDAAINAAALDRLVKLGGAKFALEMMSLFASYGGQKLAAARAACDAGNLTALAESVHPLKSSAGNVGAAQVQALAESVEALARAGDAETAAAQFNELEQAFAAALAGLETERARLAAAAPGPKL